MMYQFCDTTSAPTNAEGIKVTFGSDCLNNALGDKFRVVTVSGRGLITPDLVIDKSQFRDGGWFTSTSLPPRTITIEALLKGVTDDEFWQAQITLNRILHHGLKKLSFSDTPDWEYRDAALSMIRPFTDDSLQRFIEIELVCLDSYAYKKTTQTIINGTIPAAFVFPVLPEKIKVTLAGTATNLKITNPRTGNNISINDNFVDGDIVEVAYGSDILVKKNGSLIMTKIDITCNIEDFYVLAGDQISVVPSSATMELTLRERVNG
jgi:predicted phage tail component-like protein